MSLQIRKNLERTLRHAQRHHTAYLELRNDHPAPWSDLRKADFQAIKVRMNADVEDFEKHFDRWEILVAEIDDDDAQVEEEELMNEWLEKPDYDGMICDLRDYIAVIEAQMALKVNSPRVDRTPAPTVQGTHVFPHVVREVNADVYSATSRPFEVNADVYSATSQPAVVIADVYLATTQSSEVNADVYSATSQRLRCNTVTDTVSSPKAAQVVKDVDTLPLVTLPTLNIPKFDGDSLKWKAFWQRFDLNIHSRAYSKIQKFDTLLGLLECRALEAIEGFELSDENYDSVIQILVERFGNNDIVINQLQANLRSIEPALPNAQSIRTTVNTINNMCRQLKNYGVDIENASLRLDLIDKMPPREKGELKWLLVSSPGTTTESLLKKMTDFALKAEVIAQDRNKVVTLKPPVSNIYTAPVSSPASKFQVTNESSNKKVHCSFCDGDHFSPNCPNFLSLDAKLGQLKLKNLCTSCTRKHYDGYCNTSIKCHACKGPHYAFLCEQKNAGNANFTPLNSNTKSFVSVDKEQGFLLTKEVTVVNPLTKASVKAVVLLDCGSQRSYVSDKLIKKLSLPKLRLEKLNVHGFGGKLSTYNSALVEFQLETEDKPFTICANSSNTLTSSVPLIESFNEKSKMFAVKEVLPDILLGVDYFFKLVTSFEKRNENLFIIHSRIGEIFTGKEPKQSKNETLSSLAIDKLTVGQRAQKAKPVKSKAIKSPEVKKGLICTDKKLVFSVEPPAKASCLKKIVLNRKKKKKLYCNRVNFCETDRDNLDVCNVKPNVKQKETLSVMANKTLSTYPLKPCGGEGLFEQNANHSNIMKKKEHVRVYEPDQRRALWKLAKITNVIQSSDGEIRSAEIQYDDGFITRRSINHLYPIEESLNLNEALASNSTTSDL